MARRVYQAANRRAIVGFFLVDRAARWSRVADRWPIAPKGNMAAVRPPDSLRGR